MLPLILSFITATVFLILASVTYGVDALVGSAWVPMVFLGLLGAGATVFILDRQTSQ
jgi:hypothetical protein